MSVRPELPVLRADCGRCVGLCCVALPFGRSASFAFDKGAGEPCRHLDARDGCAIHARLRDAGMAGCTVFDCFGAGQQVVQVTFGGRSWRDDPALGEQMYAVFAVLRQVHEMLELLGQAAVLPDQGPGAASATRGRLVEQLAALSGAPAEQVLAADVDRLRAGVGEVLRAASARHRGDGGLQRAGADLLGADLRALDLRWADLRGALLVAARLDGCDLTGADLLGADLRDAVLDGADLSGAILLTGPQVAAARGDGATRLPAGLARPAHWR